MFLFDIQNLWPFSLEEDTVFNLFPLWWIMYLDVALSPGNKENLRKRWISVYELAPKQYTFVFSSQLYLSRGAQWFWFGGVAWGKGVTLPLPHFFKALMTFDDSTPRIS